MIDVPGVRRFLKYALVGGSTFLFDLLLIWLLVEFAGVPVTIATGLCFLVAVSVNYFISRRVVFRGTARAVHHGYLYFISLAVAGSLFVAGAVASLVALFALHYLVARVLVACVMGTANYLLNLHFNFKVVGVHH